MRNRSSGKRQQLERLQRQPNVLQRRHIRVAEQKQLVGLVERREHRPVEERRRVDDHEIVGLAGDLEQRANRLLADELGILRAHRSRQDVDAGRVALGVDAELLAVQRGRGAEQLAHRVVGGEAEHDRGVAELQVEVDQQRLLARMRRCRDRKVGRDDRLARAALRREDGDDTTVAADLGLAGGLGRLLDHEEHALAAAQAAAARRRCRRRAPSGRARSKARSSRARPARRCARAAAPAPRGAPTRPRARALRRRAVRLVAPGELRELEGVQRGHSLAQRGGRLAVPGEGDAEAAISGHLSPR